jgi:hypothetical protein
MLLPPAASLVFFFSQFIPFRATEMKRKGKGKRPIHNWIFDARLLTGREGSNVVSRRQQQLGRNALVWGQIVKGEREEDEERQREKRETERERGRESKREIERVGERERKREAERLGMKR